MEDIIHTQRSSLNAFPFIGVVSGIVLSTLLLIGLYGREVGSASALRDARSELEAVNAERAAIQRQIVELTQSEHLRKLAADLGLVEDKAPKYFRILDQWAAALPF